jgi:hypothetical protein
VFDGNFKHKETKEDKKEGSMPEWLKGTDCNSVGLAYAGSKPARPIFSYFLSCNYPKIALVAQW